MKRHKCFMVMAAMVALMLPCDANEAVQAAAKTALTNVTTRSLGKLYKVREQAETPECREMVIKACVAGLYAIGDTKNATKVKEGFDGNDFLNSFTSECDGCKGDGSVQKPCFNCKGSGDCQNRKCNGGVVTSAGFDGRSSTRKCSTCGGSGRCSNCKGAGNVTKVCGHCNGSKRTVNKKSALAFCHEQLKVLVATEEAKRKAKEDRRLAQQKTTEERKAKEKAEEERRLARQKAEEERKAKEKAEEESRLEKQNGDAERKAKETAVEDRRLARQEAEKKTQKDGGNSHKIESLLKLESLFGIEFGWKKPDRWNDSGYRMFDVVPAYDFSPKKKFLDFNCYTVLFDAEGRAFYMRALKQCRNLEEAYALKRKAIEVIELKYGEYGVTMEKNGVLASGKTSLVSALAYFGEELFKQELNRSYARIWFGNGKELVVGQLDNNVFVYGNDPLQLKLAVEDYRRRQTNDAVDSL